jgi:hypothetical protein
LPIDTHAYKRTGLAGCKWDRRSRTALFDVMNGRQRIRRVFSFESVEKAKAAFPDFKAKVKAGAFNDDAEASGTTEPQPKTPTGITIAEYVSSHWDSLHARCGDSTKQTNRTSYKNHVQPFFGDKAVAEITEADCEDFAAHMKATGKSPYTANLALRFLRKGSASRPSSKGPHRCAGELPLREGAGSQARNERLGAGSFLRRIR